MRVPDKLNTGRHGQIDVDERIGEGSFGAVYRGTNRNTGKRVAVKFEARDCPAPGSLANENDLLRKLAKPSQPQGFVEVYFFGHVPGATCMAMELLGKSLEQCVEECQGKIGVQSVVLIAEQAIHRIEYLHSKCLVHRDIKPENFMWGLGDKVHHLYLIDFGMTIKYWERQHLPDKGESSLVGTARYASIGAHKNRTQSRRDDMEAIGHMLFYFLRGALPWSGMKAKSDEEKYRKIGQKKEEIPVETLGEGFPQEFSTYLTLARNLKYEERPDYERLQTLFRKVRKEKGPTEDHKLQWLEGKDLHKLSPVQPWSGQIRQPDDVEVGARQRKMGSAMPWARGSFSSTNSSREAVASERHPNDQDLPPRRIVPGCFNRFRRSVREQGPLIARMPLDTE